eukprot:TRINITY_DN1740_c0_g1_i1.p1 TRINITY_DN1740_c0_g1~~TRINITY_DN1740_c0_g1_i1.p1  ORF type:complete len:307 (+),score=52.92 TRINITY_DN1740_c0_g1_i1:51-971(+)
MRAKSEGATLPGSKRCFSVAAALFAVSLFSFLQITGYLSLLSTSPTHPKIRSRSLLRCGHRGFRSKAPENTLASFQAAIRAGVDCVEMDVTLSKDGVPVVVHPQTFEQVLKYHKVPGTIHNMTVEEAQNYDLKDALGTPLSGQLETFENVIATLKNHVIMVIELKDRKDIPDGDQLVSKVFKIMNEEGCHDSCFLASYNQELVKKARKADPRFHIGYILGDYTYNSADALQLLLDDCSSTPKDICPFDAVYPQHRLITPNFLEFVKMRGLWVFTWTADDQQTIERLKSLPINGIISNQADLIASII